MDFIEQEKELLNKINSLIELTESLKRQREGNISLFTDEEYRQKYQNHFGKTIAIVEKQVEKYKRQIVNLKKQQIRMENEKKLIQIREENRKADENKREKIKDAIEAQRDYSNKNDDELKKEYSYIRSQIKRIAKKIWDISEGKDISTYYHYNYDNALVIELKSSEGVSVSEMIFEMNEIISNLEANLCAIEESYKGMDLKEIPVMEISEEELEDYQDDSLEIEKMLRDNNNESSLDNYSIRTY